VNVIAPKKLRDFITRFPEAEPFLREWYNALRNSDYANFAALRERFSSLDLARNKVDDMVHIFDVGGNKWRVICYLNFDNQTAYIKYIFTHKEYDHWNDLGRPA
jgi:mRNA interferase HigB